jgi:hypothetical protein
MNMKSTIQRLGLLILLLAAAPPRLAAQGRTMGLMYHDSIKSYQGYTLFAPMEYYVTYLIDNEGRLVHSWDAQMKPSLSVYLLDSGDLLHTAAPGSPGMAIRDWDDSLLWSFPYRGDSFYRHHDVAMLPNGNILSVARRIKSVADVRAAGRDTAKIYQRGLWADYIFEVNPSTRQVVWEWHPWDHMVQDFDSTKQNYGVVRDHPELIDLNYGVGEVRLHSPQLGRVQPGIRPGRGQLAYLFGSLGHRPLDHDGAVARTHRRPLRPGRRPALSLG